jgi:hypothetical protein
MVLNSEHEGEEYADNDDDLEASTEELQAWEVGDHPDTSYGKLLFPSLWSGY